VTEDETRRGETPRILLEAVRFRYPEAGVVALDDLSMTVDPGQVVGVIGRNGAGKSTLARLLVGLLRPTAGVVMIGDLDTRAHRVQRLAADIGYVFQNPGHQLVARTVAEELAFGPRNLGCTAEDVAARVRDAAAFFGLEDVLGSHPYRLVFPLRKLVGIAAVFTMRPGVFVLDEPTTGQDQRTVRVIERLIRRLAERGHTVICLTHDMPLVAGATDRVLVLSEGRLVADGPPRAVFADPVAMAGAGLVPPQVTTLSMQLPGRAGRPPALSVAELVAELRDGIAVPAGPLVRGS
jgi:energy-coupling factor transport system ATP-binding protein